MATTTTFTRTCDVTRRITSFPTKKALAAHLEAAVGYTSRVVGAEFFDEVLADLITVGDRRSQGMSPDSFKFAANSEGDNRYWSDSLCAHYEGFGWRRVSYHAALRRVTRKAGSWGIKPWEPKQEIEVMLRQRWTRTHRPQVLKALLVVDIRKLSCEHSGCSEPARDIDHVSPEHKDIVEAFWRKVTPADIAAWKVCLLSLDGSWGANDPGKTVHWLMPEDHPAIVTYDEMTKATEFRILCKDHHRSETADRARGVLAAGRTLADGQHHFFDEEEDDLDALLKDIL